MQTLDTLFKNWCVGQRDTHSTKCLLVVNKLRSILEKDGAVDPKIVTRYLKQLSDKSWSRCIELSDHHNLIADLFKTITPINEDIRHILSIWHPQYNYGNNPNTTILFDILQDLINKKKITSDIIQYALSSYNMGEVSKFFFKNIPADTKMIESACLHGHIDSLPQMLGQKVKVTVKSIENLLDHYHSNQYGVVDDNKKPDNIGPINLLLKYGAEPDMDCLIKACNVKDKEIIEKMLSYKIKPTKECFDELITQSTFYNRGYSRRSRRSRYSQNSNDKDKVAELIDILIAHGYTLTIEDVTDALKNGYYVNGIQRFGFTFDDKFLEKCYQYNYFPYKDLNLKSNITCLREACNKQGTLKQIKQLVKEGIEPDIECLRNACGFRSGNVPVIRYLVEVKKLKPDIGCIKQSAMAVNNGTLNYLFGQFDSSYGKIANDSDKGSDDDSDKASDNDSESEGEKPKKRAVTKTSKDKSKSDSEEEPVKRTVQKKPEPISDDDSISDEQMEESEDQIYIDKDYKKKGYKVAKIKGMENGFDGRKKQVLTDDAYNLLGIKPETGLIFSNIRTKLTKYINENQLIDKDMKNLIKPNESLRKLLNIKADEYVTLDDDDKIVSLMIKHNDKTKKIDFDTNT